MCKCVLDDQPLGRGLGRFVFEYLADAHERNVFSDAHTALTALADFDSDLAQRWAQLLSEPQPGLTIQMFDPQAEAEEREMPADGEAMARSVLAGCRHKLLGCRLESLRALRKGFTEHIDLRLQLAALTSAELLHMMRGKTEVSSADLLCCFLWPDLISSVAVEEAAGFSAIGSEVPRYLRELIPSLSGDQRLHLLEWCTALTALPCGGLKDQINLKLFLGADEEDLPNVHTCTHELHLPAYRNREQLRTKLLQAVEHRHDGFLIQ